jgi:hypothetical protein
MTSYKDLLDNDSTEKLAKGVEKAGKKILDNENVKEKITDNLEKVGDNVKDLGKKINQLAHNQIDPDRMTIDALALMYLAFELLPPLIIMLGCKLFLFEFLVSWFILIAVGIIVVMYLVIKKFEESLENSSMSVGIALVLSVCEGITLSSLGNTFDPDFFISEYIILIIGFTVACVFANLSKSAYEAIRGQRIAIVISVNFLFLLLTFFSDIFIEVVRNTQIVGTLIVGLYMFYMIGRLHDIVKKLKHEGSNSVQALYATIVVYKEKMEIGYDACVFLYHLIQGCVKSNKEPDDKKEKLLPSDGKDQKGDKKADSAKPEEKKAKGADDSKEKKAKSPEESKAKPVEAKKEKKNK